VAVKEAAAAAAAAAATTAAVMERTRVVDVVAAAAVGDAVAVATRPSRCPYTRALVRASLVLCTVC